MTPALRATGPATPRSPWPARLAATTLWCALPLVLFGGSVTTLGAGMAVEGWLIAEGHFLLFFPIESWLRDTATFVEHTHRLFGVLVGLAAIAAVISTWLWDKRTSACATSALALAAICGQGALGGFRVLENSPELAFLHGVLAQAVFALIAIHWLVASRAWAEAPGAPEARSAPSSPARPAGLRIVAVAASLAVFGQVFLGALYRHAIRPVAEADATGKLALHAVGALVVLCLVALFASALAKAAAKDPGSPASARLGLAAKRLVALLLVQLLLGAVAWAGYRPEATGPVEWGVSILHVLGGALLLSQTLVATLWVERLFRATPTPSAAAGHDADPVGEAVALGAGR